MSDFSVTRLRDIPETTDGRCPWQPVPHHLGITAFGVNVFTGHAAGDRIINEHDEADDGQEELYLVLRGHAVFEIAGERRDAPEGTLVFVRPGVTRTAFAERDEAGEYGAAADRARELVEANPQYPGPFYNLACCRAWPGGPTTRSRISGTPSRRPWTTATTREAIRTSTRSATSRSS